jgi:ATP-binding cassette subfamily B protein RaxB
MSLFSERRGMRRLPVILQSELSECGLACLAMIASYHGHQVDLNGMRLRYSRSIKGSTLRDLMSIATDLGMSARAVRAEVAALQALRLPCVLHWDLNHFVVLKQISRSSAVVHDPALGERKLALEEFSNHFTGVALELAPAQDFVPKILRRRIGLRDLIGTVHGIRRSVVQAIVLSICLQLFLLAAPFYVQLAVDDAAGEQDRELLLILVGAFASIYVLAAIAEAMRSWVVSLLGQTVSQQMTTNTMRHLIRLPVAYFEKRFVADIMSRVGSCRPIQEALTKGMVEALVDAAMAITTAVAMVVYSPALGVAIILTTSAYVGIALALQPLRRRRQREEIAARAQEQAKVMESIFGAVTVKVFGIEAERESAWANLYSRAVDAAVMNRRIEILQILCKNVVFGLQIVLVVYLGVHKIISGMLSSGMLMAVLFYRQIFAERAIALAEWIYELGLVGLHLDRLADIVETPRDGAADRSADTGRKPAGRITLEGLRFRYSQGDAEVLQGVDLEIREGEFVAIKGPSGGGKTTLLKLMLGLYEPTGGRVLIDGQALASFGKRVWHGGIGVVQQDDRLLSGSIADNISMFDPMVDKEHMIECARAACIHEEIQALPMNYLSMIGDMGSALSGGQKQRVLLARALYRRPAVLFLDEGTANLDEDTEDRIADTLLGMNITRVVIAHRRALIEKADRVLDMRGGVLTTVQPGPAVMLPASASLPA